MPSRIPSPEYISESVEGAVYDLPAATALLLGTPPALLAAYTPRLQGMLTLRYGIPCLTPATDAIVPGLMVGEKGGTLTGREAWDYMLRRFQMHPRADIIGVRSNGQTAQVWLRELDFGAAIKVFVYASPQTMTPTVAVTALVIGMDANPLPELLAQYLPITDNIRSLLAKPE